MKNKRWLVIPAVVIGAVLVARAAGVRESEWEGLTESEARAKLDAKLPDRIPEEKRTRISDKLIDKMANQGILVADDDEPADEAADESAPASET